MARRANQTLDRAGHRAHSHQTGLAAARARLLKSSGEDCRRTEPRDLIARLRARKRTWTHAASHRQFLSRTLRRGISAIRGPFAHRRQRCRFRAQEPPCSRKCEVSHRIHQDRWQPIISATLASLRSAGTRSVEEADPLRNLLTPLRWKTAWNSSQAVIVWNWSPSPSHERNSSKP